LHAAAKKRAANTAEFSEAGEAGGGGGVDSVKVDPLPSEASLLYSRYRSEKVLEPKAE